MKRLSGLFRKLCLMNGNGSCHRVGDEPAAAVEAGPGCLASAGIDLEKLDARGHLGPIANDASQDPVEGRAYRHISEMADDEILEHACADFDRRLPTAGEFRTDEAVAPTVSEAARNAVGRLGRPLLNDLSRLVRPRFDGDVAIGVTAKPGAETDRQPGEPAQIRSGKIFLHPRVHQNIEAAQNNE